MSSVSVYLNYKAKPHVGGVAHLANNSFKRKLFTLRRHFISRSYQQLWKQITGLHLKSYKNSSNCSCFIGGVKLVAGDNVM